MIENKKIAFVASECQPFFTSGGLGDVIGSLPKKIAKLDKGVLYTVTSNDKASEMKDCAVDSSSFCSGVNLLELMKLSSAVFAS